MTRLPKAFDAPLPDGVYFNLTDEEYFGQETRGSSDWVKMHFAGEGWWWGSPYNPDYKPPKAKALVYGNALHAIVLESVAAYESRFAVEPDPAEYTDLVKTAEDCQHVLEKNGYALPPGSSKWKKANWCQAVRQTMPHVPVWDLIMDDFNERLGPEDAIGRPRVVTAMEDRMLRYMREVACGDFPGNESVRKLLGEAHGYPAMAEVAVIATIGGIRRRWKFDRMFPAFDMDLKSLRGWGGRPLRFAVGDQTAKYGLDIQREDYFQGRCAAYALIQAGKVVGGTLEQRKWLATWPEKHPTWDWVWLFYQKPDPSGHAPVLFPVWDDSWIRTDDGHIPSDMRMWGGRKLAKAIGFYRDKVASDGLDRPWARVDPLHYTDERNNLSGERVVQFPHWIAEEAPTEAGAYAEPAASHADA